MGEVGSLKYPSYWPPQEYCVEPKELSEEQVSGLGTLISRNAGETELHEMLLQNRAVLARCLSWATTGHHGAWVIPKQEIRPPGGVTAPGLIPDFLVGGKSSDGFEWYVVEIKGADESLFSESDSHLRLSSVANRGICQLLEYIDYCASAQAYLRDTMRLTDFREPRGFLILGRETEFDKDVRRQRLKAAWNRRVVGGIEIHSWNGLLRNSKTWFNQVSASSKSRSADLDSVKLPTEEREYLPDDQSEFVADGGIEDE